MSAVVGQQTLPGHDEVEVTLLGPGYGESIVVHIGGGDWVIVDSCINEQGSPQALEYLCNIGVNPEEAVKLIVATHWHDDHIAGMATLTKACKAAEFCCAAVFVTTEFLAAADALERRHLSQKGSGVRELHGVFSQVVRGEARARHALADSRILSGKNCEIFALSPSHRAFHHFLMNIGRLIPGLRETKTRIPSVSPNDISIATWIRVDNIVILLGADLERHGWTEVLENRERPVGRAGIFKVAHHGSAGADEPGVWSQMLEAEPIAVLTPFRRGRHMLPLRADAQRILAYTEKAYITAVGDSSARARRRESRAVRQTIQESNIQIRRNVMNHGAIRLRRRTNPGAQWGIETIGPACHLSELL